MDYEKKKKNRKMIIKIVSAQENMNSVSWNDLLRYWKHFPSLSKKSLIVHIIKCFGDNHFSVRL